MDAGAFAFQEAMMGVKVREKIKDSKEWWVFINHGGRRTSRKVGSEKAAWEVARKIEAKLTLGEAFVQEKKPPVPTLGQYYERFKRSYLKTAVKESTRQSYATSFKVHILPAFGGKRLNEISRGMMKDFVGLLVTKGLARPTIWTITKELCAMLNHAREDGLIQDNPAEKLGKFYRQAHVVHEEIQPLTKEEVPEFLEAVLSHSPEHYALFLCAIHTGLRSGELAGLQWGDIDFSGKFLTVRRNVVRGTITTPKTEKIHRVDLSDALLKALRDLRKHQREEWLKKGNNQAPEWVFSNQKSNPPDMQNIKNRHFHKCLEKAGLRRIRFHDLRHTFASLLIQNNESLTYVKEQLGHSSIKMTVDVYGHLVPGANRQAVNRLPSLELASEHLAKSQER